MLFLSIVKFLVLVFPYSQSNRELKGSMTIVNIICIHNEHEERKPMIMINTIGEMTGLLINCTLLEMKQQEDVQVPRDAESILYAVNMFRCKLKIFFHEWFKFTCNCASLFLYNDVSFNLSAQRMGIDACTAMTSSKSQALSHNLTCKSLFLLFWFFFGGFRNKKLFMFPTLWKLSVAYVVRLRLCVSCLVFFNENSI